MKNGPYTLIVAPKDYPGKKYRGKFAYEHHVVWWVNTGITIPKGYSIHHKNHNKRDNKFANLELVSNSTHAVLHRKSKTMMGLICGYCNSAFTRDARLVRFKKSIGQKKFYCCKSHMAEDFKNVSGS